MQSFEIVLPELTPVVLEARAELNGRPDRPALQTRRVSIGEPQAMQLSPDVLSDGIAAEFLRQQAGTADFWLLTLAISFYPDSAEPIDSAAVGLLLSHDGPDVSPPAIAWSLWPTKLLAPGNQSNTITVSAQLGFIQPQISRTTTRDHGDPFLLGLGEGQSDPEWRFRRSSDCEIEGIHRLAAIIRAPRGAHVTGAVTIAASIRYRIAGLARYRAVLPAGLASISLPPSSPKDPGRDR
jgi:hypothetical protein